MVDSALSEPGIGSVKTNIKIDKSVGQFVDIPNCLIDVGYRFLKIHPKSKMPSEKWSERNYSGEDTTIKSWINNNQSYDRKNKLSGEITHYEGFGNYALIGSETSIIIEVDTPELVDYSMAHSVIGKTLRSKSGSHRGNHFYIHTDKAWTIPLIHPDMFDENGKRNINVGHIKSKGSYCVGPSSIHPTGNAYELQNEGVEILYMPFKDIINFYTAYILLKHKDEPSEKTIYKSPIGNKDSASFFGISMDMFMPEGKLIKSGDEIVGASRWHESSTGTNYRVNLRKGTWYCEHCGVGDGALTAYAIERKIISCGEAGKGSLGGHYAEIFREREKDGWVNPDNDFDDVDFSENLTTPQKKKIISKKEETPEDKEKERIRIETLSKLGKELCELPKFPFESMPQHIFKEYCNIQERLMYSHKSYHMAIILPLVSMALGRRVFSQVGPSTVYTNMTTLAAGTSTISGKSAAEDDGLFRIGPSIWVKTINTLGSVELVTDISSDTALKQMICNDISNPFWYYGDCSSFFEKITQYNRGMLPTMCTIWDSKLPVEHRLARKRDGTENKCHSDEYFMSVAMNCTISDLETYGSSSIFTSGWAPRTMWFLELGGKKRKNVIPTEEETEQLKKICETISYIKDELFNIPPNSIQFNINDKIENWNIKLTEEYDEDESEAYNTNLGRIFINCYKIAMLMAMTDIDFIYQYLEEAKTNYEEKNKKIVLIDIPDKYIEFATRVGEDYLLPRSMYVYRMSQDCDMKNNQIKVLKAIQALGGDTIRTKVMRKINIDSADLDKAVKSLKESQKIEITTMMTPKSKKPSERYILLTAEHQD